MQHWHACLLREAKWTEASGKVWLLRFCLFKKMHKWRKQNQMLPLPTSDFLHNLSPRDALKMSRIYFELSGTCSSAEGFNTLGDGTGSWGSWSVLQPDGRKSLPSGWMQERYQFHTGARFRKSINSWFTATNKDVSHASWCTMEEISQI